MSINYDYSVSTVMKHSFIDSSILTQTFLFVGTYGKSLKYVCSAIEAKSIPIGLDPADSLGVMERYH